MAAPQTGRFSNLLRRLMLTREVAGTDVISDFFPSIDLLMPRSEMFFHRAERIFSAGVGGNASAGNMTRLWCMNKQANVLAVIETVLAYSPVAIEAFLGMTNSGLPADGAAVAAGSLVSSTDARIKSSVVGVIPSAITIAADFAVAALISPLRMEITQTPLTIIPCRFVLSPGWALVLSGNLANTAVFASFLGYERTVEDAGELGF